MEIIDPKDVRRGDKVTVTLKYDSQTHAFPSMGPSHQLVAGNYVVWLTDAELAAAIITRGDGPLAVGDRVTVNGLSGTIVLINGDRAWVEYLPMSAEFEGRPDCTYAISELERFK